MPADRLCSLPLLEEVEALLARCAARKLLEQFASTVQNMRGVLAEDPRCAWHRPLPRRPGRMPCTYLTAGKGEHMKGLITLYLRS